MCTKFFSDGDVHKYFNPYGTPYEAFINYMNVLSDFIIRVDEFVANKPKKQKEIKAVITKKAETTEVVDNTENKTYRFADLEKMSNAKLKSLLSKFDSDILIKALHKTSDLLKDKLLSNVSNKVLEEFEAMNDTLKEFSDNERKNARRRIMNQLKKMS